MPTLSRASTARPACLPRLSLEKAGCEPFKGSTSDTGAVLEQRALECERKAAWVANTDEAAQERFLARARAWREMAADYEELCKNGTENNNPPADNEAEATTWFADDTLPEWGEA